MSAAIVLLYVSVDRTAKAFQAVEKMSHTLKENGHAKGE